MPRTRATPDIKEQVTEDRVGRFITLIRYTASGAVDTVNTKFGYTVYNITATGGEYATHRREISVGSLPAPVKAELKAIYNRVLTDAENQGFIGAGIDSGDDF